MDFGIVYGAMKKQAAGANKVQKGLQTSWDLLKRLGRKTPSAVDDAAAALAHLNRTEREAKAAAEAYRLFIRSNRGIVNPREAAQLEQRMKETGRAYDAAKAAFKGAPNALGRAAEGIRSGVGATKDGVQKALEGLKNGTAKITGWTTDHKGALITTAAGVVVVPATSLISYSLGASNSASPATVAAQPEQTTVASNPSAEQPSTATAQATEQPQQSAKAEPPAKTNDDYRPGSTTSNDTAGETTTTEQTNPATTTPPETDYSPWIGAAAGLAGAAGIYGLGSQFKGLRKKKNKLLRATLALLGGAGIGYGAYRLSQPETKTASYLDFKKTYKD